MLQRQIIIDVFKKKGDDTASTSASALAQLKHSIAVHTVFCYLQPLCLVCIVHSIH